MLRVEQIGLVDGAALALVDRARIAVPEGRKRFRIEGDGPARLAVEADGDALAVDRRDDTGIAVVDREPLVGAGELEAVADREIVAAVLGLEALRRAEFSPRFPHAAEIPVQLVDIDIGVR